MPQTGLWTRLAVRARASSASAIAGSHRAAAPTCALCTCICIHQCGQLIIVFLLLHTCGCGMAIEDSHSTMLLFILFVWHLVQSNVFACTFVFSEHDLYCFVCVVPDAFHHPCWHGVQNSETHSVNAAYVQQGRCT